MTKYVLKENKIVKVEEAGSVDRMYVQKELKDFDIKIKNPKDRDFDELADTIAKHLGMKEKNKGAFAEHLMMSYTGNGDRMTGLPIGEFYQFLK